MTHEYIGTKIVTAWPQEKDGQPGYAVKYADGYTSWSPKDTFEAAYIDIGHVSHLPAYQQRMVGEKAELDVRLDRLNAFLESDAFRGLPEPDRYMLEVQAKAMTAYSNALGIRIDRLSTEKKAADLHPPAHNPPRPLGHHPVA